MELEKMGALAVKAKYELARLDTDSKDKALLFIADALIKDTNHILSENKKDIESAIAQGMSQPMQDRLLLNDARIIAMAEGIRQVAKLDDPCYKVLETFTRPNGLSLQKISVPIGVIGIIYESRPNVTADAFSLCFKSGNAVILKGGSDAIYSNIAITECIRKALSDCGFNPDFIQLITATDRETTSRFMKMNGYVDVLIPRGGAGLIAAVVKNATVPVIETGSGNCHIYVDENCDIDMAVKIIVNAKTQRTGVCNACESLVVHENIRSKLLPALEKELSLKNVEIRADEQCLAYLENAALATEQDFAKEYLDLIISMKTVSSVEEAVEHINKNNTGHSEAIITTNQDHADYFKRNIDASCVYVNASTRFTDGFEFGFGAEIGISTQKLHARGPMGLRELTSYKYLIDGQGQIRE